MNLPDDKPAHALPRRCLGDVDNVTAVLGLPRTTIYGLLRRGVIPGAVRVGRRWKIDLDKFAEWIGRGGGRR